MRTLVPLFTLVLCFALVACDDEPRPKDTDTDVEHDADVTDSETTTEVDASELDAAPDELDDETESDADELPEADAEDLSDDIAKLPCNEGGSYLARIRGAVVDENGAPLAGARPQPCVREPDGKLTCMRPEPTGDDGLFVQSFEGLCLTEVTMRVSAPGSGRPTVYCPIPVPSDSAVLDIAEPFVLRPSAAPTSLPPLADPASVHTVVYDSGLSVAIVPERLYLPTGEYTDLAGLSVDPGGAGLCFLGDTAPLFVFGFYPEAEVDDAGFPFSLPNSFGLAANAAVDLYVLGGLDCLLDDGTPVHEGEWHRFGQGQVSADGNSISSAQGLPCLTWFGIAVP